MKFAKAVYCYGVDTWYVRLGSQHGIDVMFATGGAQSAKIQTRLINQSLARELKARGWVKATRREVLAFSKIDGRPFIFGPTKKQQKGKK